MGIKKIIIIFSEPADIQALENVLLTGVLVGDLIKTILKHFVEVHGLVLRASHLGHTDNTGDGGFGFGAARFTLFLDLIDCLFVYCLKVT